MTVRVILMRTITGIPMVMTMAEMKPATLVIKVVGN
jgi:hypothetical protein